MNYIGALSSEQLKNLSIVVKAFPKWGITNKFTQAAILAIISKESSFKYSFEKGYGNTDNSRIRKIFGSRVSQLSEDRLSAIKKDDKAFFNLVYAGRYGNGPEDGYKYRGGGPNQLTFKSNYDRTGKHIGVDLINHPEKVNDSVVAADIACSYFVRGFNSFKLSHQEHYKSNGINGFKDLTNATLAVYHANAGFGKPVYSVEKINDSTGGLKKALSRAPEFLAHLDKDKVVLPFKDRAEGNRFRNWVNNTYPEYAKEINLDRTGSHTNSYILSAWDKLSDKYTK